MSDATIITQPAADTVTGYDVDNITINPPISGVRSDGRVFYRLRENWSSGRVVMKEGNVSASDFGACLAAWCQASPKKKFLTWLASNGYESNLSPQ